MRITLVTSQIGGGGAERCAVNMANYWAEKHWEATLVSTFRGDPSSDYRLHPGARHLRLSDIPYGKLPIYSQDTSALFELIELSTHVERDFLIRRAPHITHLRRALVETGPEVVISQMDFNNICVLAGVRGLGLPVIVTEHCDAGSNRVGADTELLRRRLYPQASFVVALTEESHRYFSSIAGVRCRIIPNAVTPPVFSTPDSTDRKNGKTLIAMGRLSGEKGFDLLLGAFSLIVATHPDWTLEILGEGPQRAYLESRVQALGLAERVRLPGFTRHPFDALRRADLFVLPSLCEGFPNALLEAMACGLAAVSFDCPSGPRHIIRHGVDGILVPPRDSWALAVALDRLMGDEAERKRLAARALEVNERFSAERIMGLWEELIFDCVSERRVAAATQTQLAK